MMQQYSCKILLKYSRRVVYLKMLKKGVIYACRLQTLIDPRSSLWCVCVYIYIYVYASALYFYWIQSGYKSLCSLFDIIIISNLICICCFLKVESSKWRKPVVFYKENEWKLQPLRKKLLDPQWTQLLQQHHCVNIQILYFHLLPIFLY